MEEEFKELEDEFKDFKFTEILDEIEGLDTLISAKIPLMNIDIVLSKEEEELMNQVQDEVKLEVKHPEQLDSLQKRLAELRKFQPSKTTNDPSVKIAASVPTPVTLDDLEDESDRWCCICNEDGVYVCKDCDGDVYCKQCFREGHDDPEFKSHSYQLLA